MNKRVAFSTVENTWRVRIDGNLEGWMKTSLLSWIILWFSMGGYVVMYLVTNDLDTETSLFFVTYLLFWAWFSYKALYAYLFKVYGYEWVELSSKELNYGLDILGFKTTKYRTTLENLKVSKEIEESKSFGFVYGQSFWVVGNEKLRFEGAEKSKSFGMHLSPAEANNLLGKLNQRIKTLKKS